MSTGVAKFKRVHAFQNVPRTRPFSQYFLFFFFACLWVDSLFFSAGFCCRVLVLLRWSSALRCSSCLWVWPDPRRCLDPVLRPLSTPLRPPLSLTPLSTRPTPSHSSRKNRTGTLRSLAYLVSRDRLLWLFAWFCIKVLCTLFFSDTNALKCHLLCTERGDLSYLAIVLYSVI